MCLQELVLDDASVWKRRCEAFGITSLTGWNVSSYRDLYRTLLHKHGHLKGECSHLHPSLRASMPVTNASGCVHMCLSENIYISLHHA